jgi:spermidine synthase
VAKKKKGTVKDEPSGQRANSLILVFLLLSGSCGLIYEIVWMKMLTLVIGNTVFAITTVLTAFMGGLALGSHLAGRLEGRIKQLLQIYGLLEGGIGIYALLLPIFAARFLFDTPRSFQYIQRVEFAVIFGLILVPTFMMGATVPVAVKICTTDVRQVGKFFGNVYAINTLGAIIGSFMAGFILIPWLGTRNSLLIAVAMNILTAGLLFLRASTPALSRRVIGSVAIAVMAVLVWYPLAAWDASILIGQQPGCIQRRIPRS